MQQNLLKKFLLKVFFMQSHIFTHVIFFTLNFSVRPYCLPLTVKILPINSLWYQNTYVFKQIYNKKPENFFLKDGILMTRREIKHDIFLCPTINVISLRKLDWRYCGVIKQQVLNVMQKRVQSCKIHASCTTNKSVKEAIKDGLSGLYNQFTGPL